MNLLQKNNRLITVFLTVLLVCCVLLGSGAPAAAASIPSEDTYRVSFQNDQLIFRTERTAYTIADADESNIIKIPLYFWYSSSASDNTYLSGWVIMAQTRFMNFTFNTGSVVPSYFEAYDGGSYYCSSPVSDYRFTLYFDNHITANNTPHLLGYYVFDVSAYTAIQIDVTSGTTNVNIASSGVYGSTGQYGLVQSIIYGLDNSDDIDTIIGALQNIDTVDLEAIISGISSNTSLLTQIYQRLGLMQSENQTFYNNIDDIIDTISWNNISSYSYSWSDSLGGVFNNDSLTSNTIYFKFNGNTTYSSSSLLYFSIPLRNTSRTIPNYDLSIFIYSNGGYYKISDIFYKFSYNHVDVFLDNVFLYQSTPTYIIFESNYPLTIYGISYGKYILNSDIEYWSILSDLQNNRLYNLIESYINANVSDPVDQAATQAAGLAQNQLAAEQSLAALSPGRMEDLDAADAFDILDETANSTRFWTMLVNEFSISSGVLWGVFIFALMIGLIAFILRLR